MSLSGQLQGDLSACFLLSDAFELAGAYLPSKLLLEGEGTPGSPRPDVFAARAATIGRSSDPGLTNH